MPRVRWAPLECLFKSELKLTCLSSEDAYKGWDPAIVELRAIALTIPFDNVYSGRVVPLIMSFVGGDFREDIVEQPLRIQDDDDFVLDMGYEQDEEDEDYEEPANDLFDY